MLFSFEKFYFCTNITGGGIFFGLIIKTKIEILINSTNKELLKNSNKNNKHDFNNNYVDKFFFKVLTQTVCD